MVSWNSPKKTCSYFHWKDPEIETLFQPKNNSGNVAKQKQHLWDGVVKKEHLWVISLHITMTEYSMLWRYRRVLEILLEKWFPGLAEDLPWQQSYLQSLRHLFHFWCNWRSTGKNPKTATNSPGAWSWLNHCTTPQKNLNIRFKLIIISLLGTVSSCNRAIFLGKKKSQSLLWWNNFRRTNTQRELIKNPETTEISLWDFLKISVSGRNMKSLISVDACVCDTGGRWEPTVTTQCCRGTPQQWQDVPLAPGEGDTTIINLSPSTSTLPKAQTTNGSILYHH